MIRIFSKNDEIIIVGLDANGNIIDPDGILSSHESKKRLETFSKVDFDPQSGMIIRVNSHTKSTTQHKVVRLIQW